jgi:hypothetical protein
MESRARASDASRLAAFLQTGLSTRPDEALQTTTASNCLPSLFTWLVVAILIHIHARMHF